MYIFQLLMYSAVIKYAESYNLDFEYAVVKNGPENSLFGFSVAEHVEDITEKPPKNWILVGAPKASNKYLKSKYQNSGTIFKCKPTDPSFTCTEQVPFDLDVTRVDENKTNEWLGVSIVSGGPFRDVAACAHRYIFQGLSSKFRLHEGKCFQISSTLDEDSSLTPYSVCNSFNKDPSKTANHEYYGQCVSGIGLDVLPVAKSDATSFLIGAAGARWFSGEFFEVDDEEKTAGMLPPQIQEEVEKKGVVKSSVYRSSYFGYSLAYGNFLTNDTIQIASGGPRHNHFGMVLLYEQKVTKANKKEKRKTLIQEINSTDSNTEKIQIASGFGIALCSIDSDNSGLAELIVGAPFYLLQGAKDRPEAGIVYIYAKHKDKNLLAFQKTLQGGYGAYSNFGYAIANGGDLNLDKYEDLVVGAPREDDGAGAIYVFHGSKDGLITKHTQRIAAGTIHSGLVNNIGFKGFGRSISTGLDMDDNGYKDVLVGAYLSNKVALLRGRPVLHVITNMEYTPKQVDTSVKECPFSQQIKAPCVKVKFCYNISEPSRKLETKNQIIKIKYIIEADPITRTVPKPRVVFSEKGSNIYEFIGKSTSQVFYQCKELGMINLLYNEDGFISEYPDISFRVSYDIPYGDIEVPKPTRTSATVPSLDEYPVLQQKMTADGAKDYTFYSFKLNFKRNCTNCIPDLSISSEKTNYTIRLGKKTFSFNVTIANRGIDPAYSVGLKLFLAKSLTLNEVLDASGTSVCAKSECPNLVYKLLKGQKKIFQVSLSTESFDPRSERNITLDVNSANDEKPGTTDDNKLEITFDLKIVADVQLWAIQNTQGILYMGKIKGESAMTSLEDTGPLVVHEYAIKNNGPDTLPLANLTIEWPYQTKSGKHLLYLQKVDNQDCIVGDINALNLKSDGTTPARALQVQKDATSTKATTGGVSRMRRDISNVSAINKVDEPLTSKVRTKEGRVLDCATGTADCIYIQCRFHKMASGEEKKISIFSRLWETSLLLDYYGEILTVVSRGTVVIGINASYISDPDLFNQEGELFTVITPQAAPKSKEKIAVWQIALAVAAGVVLLGLMIFGLYKVGFFHRTREMDENGADKPLVKK